MFDTLSERLQESFRNLSRKGRLSDQDVEQSLREVRLALLEADVNYRVVRDFTKSIRERAVGSDLAKSLTPAQTVIKIVHEEMITLLGESEKLDLGGPAPTIIMLVGLQGSGKTTMAAKLALHLRKNGESPLLVAADTYRPAAIAQLETLGAQINVPVHSEGDRVSPVVICQNAVKRAKKDARTVVLIDTAGRLQIDDQMMRELGDIRKKTSPREVLLIIDSMTGQEAVSVADEFNKRVPLTGLALTKVDGDARGGAALSVRAVTGVPIKFMGTGERPEDIEVFHADRLASRILGMGDVLTLIERAETAFSDEQARKMEEKFRTASFTFEDFVEQLRAMRNMGPITDILGMIPGLGQAAKQLPAGMAEQSLTLTESIINSMTVQERRNPKVINASRKRRIARGSGHTVQEVNQLLRQFNQMQQIMRQMQQGKGRGLLSLFR